MSELSTPLGLKPPTSGKTRRPIGTIASVATVAMAASVVLWILVVDDPLGGEPTAVAAIGHGNPDAAQAPARDGLGTAASSAADPDVIAAVAPPRGVTAPVRPPDGAISGMSLPVTALAELEEDGPHGRLPRIADSGLRPLDAYARPAPVVAAAAPKVAVVVGGLGLSQTGTQEALRQLPSDVTLAFAPYGASLDRWTTRARQAGHELLVQVPLEPFDYPQNDPGPHTLVTGDSAAANRDSLHWLMSRIGAYVGVMTYMGARFTADDKALGPVLAELTARGLMFVDEGSSPLSRSSEIASTHETPFAQGDIVLDAVATESEIAARLAQLEQIARGRGVAVGVASALPVSVRTIGQWAATLERRGITLVPISATIGAQ